MSEAAHEFMRLDLMPLLAGVLTAVTCGLLGNFLVLRKLSLMGDAISHAVLPGLVVAFLISGMRTPLPMFIGAAIAGAATVVLVELVKKLGRVESGAAMGVVFSLLFALGVLLIEGAAARHTDLDADCVLHGNLQSLFWSPPGEWSDFWRWSTLGMLPRQVGSLMVMCVLVGLFVSVFFKELRIAAFDAELATTQGMHAGVLHYALMLMVAGSTVAAFEAVGSILVIAMLICPAATARMLTDRLGPQMIVSVVVALVTGVAGYLVAASLDVNAAGMMTVVAGALFALAAVASPSHGAAARLVRRSKLRRRIDLEDVLARLYRLEERGVAPVGRTDLLRLSGSSDRQSRRAMNRAGRRGWIVGDGSAIRLTDEGRRAAARIVRRHRQWETYLVGRAGVRADQVHPLAESFEHLVGDDAAPIEPPIDADSDPHGRPIPPADA